MHIRLLSPIMFSVLVLACSTEKGDGPEAQETGSSTMTGDTDFDTATDSGDSTVGTNTESGSETMATDSVTATEENSSTDDSATHTLVETSSSSGDTDEAECGDGTVNGDELCEVEDTADCSDLDTAWRRGRAECLADCSGWNGAACAHGICGNGQQETDEACDGDVVDCDVLDSDLYSSGVARCNDSCTSLDVSECQMSTTVTFERSFGGVKFDYANDALQTYDGGYLLAGNTWSFAEEVWTPKDPEFLISNHDVLLVRLDARGDVLWYRNYGGPYPESARSMVRAHDGGTILAGEATVPVGRTVIRYNNQDVEVDKIRDFATLTKVDEAGNVIWSRLFGQADRNQGFYAVIATSDGGYLAVGEQVAFKGNTQDEAMIPFPSLDTARKYFYAVKVDLYGKPIWEKAFFGPGSEWGDLSAVAEGEDGYYACGGMVLVGVPGRDTFAVELAADTGDVLWLSRYPGRTQQGGDDYANGLAVLRDESGDVTGLAITGVDDYSYNYATKRLSGNIRVVWTDSSGQLVSSKSYDISGKVDPVTGYTKPGIDYGVDIVPVDNGDFVVLATVLFDVYFQSYEESDVYLMRIDPAGNVQWAERYGRPQRYDTPAALVPTYDGGFFVTGATQSFLEEGDPPADEVHMLKTDANGRCEAP